MQTQTSDLDNMSSSSILPPFSIHDLWESIRRHKYLVIGMTLAMLALSVIYVATAERIYEAKAVVLLENNEKNVNLEAVLSKTLIDATFVTSEIQVLISRTMMDMVLSEIEGQNKKIEDKAKPLSMADRNKLDNKINAALGNLNVTQLNKSRAIQISFQSKDPEYAANIVNTLTRLYTQSQMTNRFDTIQTTTDWLNKRVQELRRKVFETDTKVVEYRRREGLVATRGIDIIEQDISEISEKLTDARADLVKAESRLGERKNYSEFDTSTSVLSSSLIQKLREQESQARNEVAELSQEYGSGHPTIIAAKARLDSINSKIAQEIKKISSGLDLEYQVAKENVQRTEKELEKLKTEYNTYKSASVELQALEREANANREILEALNARLKETQAQEEDDLQGSYTRILSEATVPQKPVKPKGKLIIAAAVIAGLGLGIALAIGLDQFQNGIYNGKQLQEILHINNIALVPKIKLQPEKEIHSLADFPLREPYHVYTESIRAISMYLRLQMSKDPHTRVFNFTSSMGNEGKSNLIASLGRQMAMEGLRVLAIDCDIRRSKLGLILGKNSQLGLGDLLKQTASLDEVTLKDKSTNLSYICAGKMKDVNIISRQIDNWNGIMDEAMSKYDIVLIDSPPILFVSDTKLIAKNCQNILCIRWKKTPVNMIRFAIDTMNRLECSILGTVITLSENRSSYLYEYEYKDPEAT